MKDIKNFVGDGACKRKKESKTGLLKTSISPAKKHKGEVLRNSIIEIVELLQKEVVMFDDRLKEEISAKVDEAYSEKEELHEIQASLEKEKETVANLIMRGATSIYSPSIKRGDGKTPVELVGERVTTRVDLLDNLKGAVSQTVTAIRIETGKPVIRKNGRTTDTSAKKSPIIYSLLETARLKGVEMGLSDFNAEALVVYLRSNDDKKGVFIPSLREDKELIRVHIPVTNGLFSESSIKPYVEAMEEAKEGRENKAADCEFCELKNHCKFTPSPIPAKAELEETPISAMRYTPAQKEAIGFYEGCSRVIAGAGSGKTTTTCVRVAELVAAGTKPEAILFIAFTNAAVKATREKLSKVFEAYGFEPEEADKVKVFTFNSFGQKILEEHYSLCNKQTFTAPPKVADDVQKVDILISTLNIWGFDFEALDVSNPFMNYGSTKGFIHYLLDYVEELDDEEFTYMLPNGDKDKLKKIANSFYEAMSRANHITYKEQISYSSDILLYNPELIDEYGIEHIIVDEFQDTSKDDMQLLTHIINSLNFKSLMVVGDDMQAIYGFRGATPDNFLKLPGFIGMPVTDIYFTDNFRSTEEICLYADKVGNQIKTKLPKKLVSHKRGGEAIRFMDEDKMKEITGSSEQAIVDEIEALINKGKKPSDIAFIGRTKREVLNMQKVLTERNIPTQTDLSINCLESSKVKAVIGLAGYLISLLTEGVDSSEVAVYDFIDAIEGGTFEPTFENIEKVKREAATLNDMFEKAEDKEKVEIFFNLCNALNDGDVVYGKFLESLENYRKATIGTLLGFCCKLNTYNISLEVRVEATQEAVTLLTAHSSKGLEYDTVIVSLTNFDNDKYTVTPLQPFGSDALMDDIYRLIYVAVTRAKEKLIICSKGVSKYKYLT